MFQSIGASPAERSKMAKKSEKAPIFMVRRGNTLHPEMRLDVDAIHAISEGQRVKVEITEPRNLDRLRLYWRMLSYVRDATECAPTSEHLHSAIKLELGYGTPVRLRGLTVLVPASIAFDKMDETEFRGFFDRAVKFLADTYGFDPLEFYKDQAA